MYLNRQPVAPVTGQEAGYTNDRLLIYHRSNTDRENPWRHHATNLCTERPQGGCEHKTRFFEVTLLTAAPLCHSLLIPDTFK